MLYCENRLRFFCVNLKLNEQFFENQIDSTIDLFRIFVFCAFMLLRIQVYIKSVKNIYWLKYFSELIVIIWSIRRDCDFQNIKIRFEFLFKSKLWLNISNICEHLCVSVTVGSENLFIFDEAYCCISFRKFITTNPNLMVKANKLIVGHCDTFGAIYQRSILASPGAYNIQAQHPVNSNIFEFCRSEQIT